MHPRQILDTFGPLLPSLTDSTPSESTGDYLTHKQNYSQRERGPGRTLESLPDEFVRPRYDSYCLSNVAPTILSLFGVKSDRPRIPKPAFGDIEVDSADRVILILLDGFGYKEWRKRSSEGFVKAMTEKGHVRPITTVFPSTTAAALTSLSTGLTPQEHGLPEWFVYFRELDMIIATLPFSPMGDPGRDTLSGVADPKILFSGEPFYKRLGREGIKSHSFVNRSIAGSAYSRTSLKGSEAHPYVSSSDLTAMVRRQVEAAGSPCFFYVYWSYVDTIEHKFGPNTDESSMEAATISYVIQKGLIEKLDSKVAKKTLVIVTADHGQVNVSPKATLYLNRFRRVVRNFEKSAAGNPILPAGSPRDVFLHVGEVEETKAYLRAKLRGRATTVATEDAIEMGIFGRNRPTKKFRDRVGDLVILPHNQDTIWYDHRKDLRGTRQYRAQPGRFDLLGHHGGLSKDEMMIPFGVARLSDLQ